MSASTIVPAVDVILVGGVPGAGKSTAIRQATADLPDVVVLDPENRQRALQERLPVALPYRTYRWFVHVAHTAEVLLRLLLGPVPGQRLVVHDPGTRRRRRRLFVALARSRGWRTAFVYVDVNRQTARLGQEIRGRVLRLSAFDRHWTRWEQMRARLIALQGTEEGWHRVLLVDRAQAAGVLRSLCREQLGRPALTRTAVRSAA